MITPLRLNDCGDTLTPTQICRVLQIGRTHYYELIRHRAFPMDRPRPAKAKLDLQDLEKAARLLRLAIAKAGLTPKEASALVDVNDASQFNRMLDGIEKFPVHLLLSQKARVILRELLIQSLKETGECEAYRVIRIREGA